MSVRVIESLTHPLTVLCRLCGPQHNLPLEHTIPAKVQHQDSQNYNSSSHLNQAHTNVTAVWRSGRDFRSRASMNFPPNGTHPLPEVELAAGCPPRAG